MGHLAALNKYFLKYKWRLILGLLFVTISNLFAVLPPVVVRNVIDEVIQQINSYRLVSGSSLAGEFRSYVFRLVLQSGLVLLALALLRGVFMFCMRQTIIVMSRFIEFDQKNEIYRHYQDLDMHFFKTHFTGDLMNRISEDVSRVRMYTGPSIMYATNLLVLTVMCVWGMLRVDPLLTVFVTLSFPLLAVTIYFVNKIIHTKSEQIQEQLSSLTSTAQESYSGIRVIKAFVQEKTMLRFFNQKSDEYRKSATGLALTEAVYFPSMTLFIGLSMLSTVAVGGYLAIKGEVSAGNIAEFVIYINLLMFPISSIGWVASMVQRASASQKRINEFLQTEPVIQNPAGTIDHGPLQGEIHFNDVSFTYPHTGIRALKDFNLKLRPGEKVAVIGKTGSGKSTLAQLLLRMYDTTEGMVLLDGRDIRSLDKQALRSGISYAPQDTYLFSDTIFNNIRFGRDDATEAEVREAARLAALEKDIQLLPKGYETVVGERGVMLSGGQKQRIVLARALLKNSKIIILDEALSAVDTRTEREVVNNLGEYLKGKTTIVITHRLFSSLDFDRIIVLEDGVIAEEGTHEQLIALEGRYAKLHRHQTDTTSF